jgi:cytochrome P450 / NADPH-cytochrome P450 reductase
MTWALYFIAKDPNVQQKLHEEIDHVLGDSELKFEQLSELHFLQCVLNETLRYILTSLIFFIILLLPWIKHCCSTLRCEILKQG